MCDRRRISVAFQNTHGWEARDGLIHMLDALDVDEDHEGERLPLLSSVAAGQE